MAKSNDIAAGDDVVLLVEDRDDDVHLIKRALRKTSLPRRVEVAPGGAEAIAYLSGAGPYADRRRFPLPALVILDLRMPGVSGYDVLEWLRGRADLAAIPVVVFSSVAEEQSVKRTYGQGARFYFVKPVSAAKYPAIFSEVESFFATVRKAEARRRPRGGAGE